MIGMIPGVTVVRDEQLLTVSGAIQMSVTALERGILVHLLNCAIWHTSRTQSSPKTTENS
jgi:hypothetical protein